MATMTQSRREIAAENVVSCFAVEGLSCGECVRVITEHLRHYPGMLGVNVSIVLGRIYVQHNKVFVGVDEIRTELHACGITLQEDVKGEEEDKQRCERFSLVADKCALRRSEAQLDVRLPVIGETMQTRCSTITILQRIRGVLRVTQAVEAASGSGLLHVTYDPYTVGARTMLGTLEASDCATQHCATTQTTPLRPLPTTCEMLDPPRKSFTSYFLVAAVATTIGLSSSYPRVSTVVQTALLIAVAHLRSATPTSSPSFPPVAASRPFLSRSMSRELPQPWRALRRTFPWFRWVLCLIATFQLSSDLDSVVDTALTVVTALQVFTVVWVLFIATITQNHQLVPQVFVIPTLLSTLAAEWAESIVMDATTRAERRYIRGSNLNNKECKTTTVLTQREALNVTDKTSFLIQQTAAAEENFCWRQTSLDGKTRAVAFEVDPQLLQIGDLILVKTGQCLPADVIVLQQQAATAVEDGCYCSNMLLAQGRKALEVQTALPGTMVMAGEVNLGRPLLCCVAHIGGDTGLNEHLRLVQQHDAERQQRRAEELCLPSLQHSALIKLGEMPILLLFVVLALFVILGVGAWMDLQRGGLAFAGAVFPSRVSEQVAWAILVTIGGIPGLCAAIPMATVGSECQRHRIRLTEFRPTIHRLGKLTKVVCEISGFLTSQSIQVASVMVNPTGMLKAQLPRHFLADATAATAPTCSTAEGKPRGSSNRRPSPRNNSSTSTGTSRASPPARVLVANTSGLVLVTRREDFYAPIPIPQAVMVPHPSWPENLCDAVGVIWKGLSLMLATHPHPTANAIKSAAFAHSACVVKTNAHVSRSLDGEVSVVINNVALSVASVGYADAPDETFNSSDCGSCDSDPGQFRPVLVEPQFEPRVDCHTALDESEMRRQRKARVEGRTETFTKSGARDGPNVSDRVPASRNNLTSNGSASSKASGEGPRGIKPRSLRKSSSAQTQSSKESAFSRRKKTVSPPYLLKILVARRRLDEAATPEQILTETGVTAKALSDAECVCRFPCICRSMHQESLTRSTLSVNLAVVVNTPCFAAVQEWGKQQVLRGHQVSALIANSICVGGVSLKCPVLPAAVELVRAAQRRGVDTWLCSSDSFTVAQEAAERAGVQLSRVVSKAMPRDRLALVHRLSQLGNGLVGAIVVQQRATIHLPEGSDVLGSQSLCDSYSNSDVRMVVGPFALPEEMPEPDVCVYKDAEHGGTLSLSWLLDATAALPLEMERSVARAVFLVLLGWLVGQIVIPLHSPGWLNSTYFTNSIMAASMVVAVLFSRCAALSLTST